MDDRRAKQLAPAPIREDLLILHGPDNDGLFLILTRPLSLNSSGWKWRSLKLPHGPVSPCAICGFSLAVAFSPNDSIEITQHVI